MNLEEYISSGILEAYVLGQLDDHEIKQVEEMLVKYPELHNELEKIEVALEKFAFQFENEVPKETKGDFLKTLDNQKPKFNYTIWLAAASVILAFSSSIIAIDYYNKWQDSQKTISELVQQNSLITDNLNTVNQKIEEYDHSVSIFNNENYQRIVLAGTDNSPESKAVVYWNPQSNDVYLSIQNMAFLNKDQQYQLWAIIDGQPVDAGVFDLKESQPLLEMKNIAKTPAAFAVTIEPIGGSKNPSLETMQVIGNV